MELRLISSLSEVRCSPLLRRLECLCSRQPLNGTELGDRAGSHRKNWLMLISIIGGSVAMGMYFIDPGSDNAQLLFVTAITINNLW